MNTICKIKHKKAIRKPKYKAVKRYDDENERKMKQDEDSLKKN